MDDPSITTTINGEERLASALQIDCELAASTSLTWDSTLTTPMSDHTGNGDGNNNNSSKLNHNETSGEWIDFYNGLKRTPPKATRIAQFQDTLTTANELLKLSDESDFQDKSFGDLEDDQQAILMLMIIKGMDKVFDGGRQANAKALMQALRPESKEYKRMMSFVRRGGDFRCPIESLLQQRVSQYVQNFTEEEATTIFKARPSMAPFLHLQREDSYICAYNACSALLYYYSHNKKWDKNDDETISTIRMNISKYVRDEVEGLEIANFALTTVKGASYLKRVLLGLMKSFGTGDCHEVQGIPIFGSEEENYSQLKAFLNAGTPFVFGIECFPSLANKKQLEYTGKIIDYYVDISNERPKDQKDRVYHALLCTGIKPRNDRLPPMLLVQDSCSCRPVFEIGLDLLMDMGLKNLELCTVPYGWTLNENMDYMVSPEIKALFCGSPMSLDDKDIPRIINPEKPVQVRQREDMSRYLDVVTVKRGEVLVVMT